MAADVHDAIVTTLQQHRHIVTSIDSVKVTIVEVRPELAHVQS